MKERKNSPKPVTLTFDIAILVAASTLTTTHLRLCCRSPSLTILLTFDQPPSRLTLPRHSPTLTTTCRHHHSSTPTVVAYLATNQSVNRIGQKEKP
ncbi:hypothetical protein PIB30_086740 [Stylosanthes scabra]|uniref:Uncharacterized protein n=1 Tax=Stylosanthes scabra TaxID=79078 RepID=A0ABU6QUF1_9FABA|nr:hypothetical protein [Stylosanthes scabra]